PSFTTDDPTCHHSCDEAANNCKAADEEGTPCNNFNYCDGSDSCDADGNCTVHTGNPCPPHDPKGSNCMDVCSNDSPACQADPSVGTCCTGPEPNLTACDDGVFCDGKDRCLVGTPGISQCQPTNVSPCPGPNDNDNCRESCNEADHNCSANDPDNSPCN